VSFGIKWWAARQLSQNRDYPASPAVALSNVDQGPGVGSVDEWHHLGGAAPLQGDGVGLAQHVNDIMLSTLVLMGIFK